VAGNSGAPLSVAPTGTDYGWFACLTSAGAPTFNNSLGTNVWDGALTAGQLFTGIDPGPTTTTHASYTDGSGNVWSLFRQELLLTNESFWVN
jgi:hypothetical protein